MKKNLLYLLGGIFVISLVLLITAGSLQNQIIQCKKDCSVLKTNSDKFCKNSFLNGSLECKSDYNKCVNVSKIIPIGGDVDLHGCKPSAGYMWCYDKHKCGRPWELNCSRWDENSTITIDKTILNQRLKDCMKNYTVCNVNNVVDKNSCNKDSNNNHTSCENTCNEMNKCNNMYYPICGVNGKNYTNECFMNLDKTQKACDGTCPCKNVTQNTTIVNCVKDIDCGQKEYCQLNSCGAVNGTCQKIPDICPMIYTPVCGCDSKTYSNLCDLMSNKESLATNGTCPLNINKISCSVYTNQTCKPDGKLVCGWFNTNVQCLKYPCALNFHDSCSACSDSKVDSFSLGKCPTGF